MNPWFHGLVKPGNAIPVSPGTSPLKKVPEKNYTARESEHLP